MLVTRSSCRRWVGAVTCAPALCPDAAHAHGRIAGPTSAQVVKCLRGVETTELERMLEATLAVTRPTPRDLRDALLDFFVTFGAATTAKLVPDEPQPPEDGLIRRLLLARLDHLWGDLGSSWAEPAVADLLVFRRRLERHAGFVATSENARIRTLLDEVTVAAMVTERLARIRRTTPVKRWSVVDGGGERTEPRGRLELVSMIDVTPIKEG